MSEISFPGLGITVNPSPVAFSLFGKDIYWYGIVIACGFLIAILYMEHRAKDFGLKSDTVLDFAIYVMPIAIICARIYYCVFYWDLYRDNPIACLYIWEGGLAIYGGVLGAMLTLFIYSKVKKLPFLPLLDVASMGVIIGQIFGRWGNFFNREAHGGETTSFLRMGLTGTDGVTRYYHPTFLYESVWNLVGLMLMMLLSRKKSRRWDGEIAFFYLGWYGIGRFFIEGLRTDSLYLWNSQIRVSQVVALACVAAALVFFAVRLFGKKLERQAMYVNRKTEVKDQDEKKS